MNQVRKPLLCHFRLKTGCVEPDPEEVTALVEAATDGAPQNASVVPSFAEPSRPRGSRSVTRRSLTILPCRCFG